MIITERENIPIIESIFFQDELRDLLGYNHNLLSNLVQISRSQQFSAKKFQFKSFYLFSA